MKINKRGFTIIELMISTTILGVLLLITSAAVIGLTRQFYKGINQAKTQEVARSIADEIASNIQYSKNTPMRIDNLLGENIGWCIADRRYMFITGQKLGTNAANNESRQVLIREADCSGGATPPTLGDGTELVSQNMRLINFQIEQSTSGIIYKITVTVGYGDDDLFCSPDLLNCDAGASILTVPQLKNSTDLRCKQGSGSQYCAVSKTSLSVVRRL
jgi:prepilin-type N-terminal cleavage/methylation domain-containing protein